MVMESKCGSQVELPLRPLAMYWNSRGAADRLCQADRGQNYVSRTPFMEISGFEFQYLPAR